MRKIRLITNCERPINYLMRISIKYWLKTFKPDEMIFLVNNITGFDFVEDLKNNFNIDAVRINNLEEASTTNGCLVWDYLNCNNYDLYHELDRDIVNNLQEFLLSNGTDVVIFLDRDEMLYHKDLRKVLNTFQEPIIRPRGIEIIQTGDEYELDENMSLHEQRSYMRYYPSKSKPCIARKPYKWQTGRHLTLCNTYPHGDDAGPEAEYEGLYLIHIDKIDINLLYQLRLESDKIFVNNNYSVGIIDPNEYQKWFTEAHYNGELYQDNEFLKEIDI